MSTKNKTRKAKYVPMMEAGPGYWEPVSYTDRMRDPDSNRMVRAAEECGFDSYADAWDDVRRWVSRMHKAEVEDAAAFGNPIPSRHAFDIEFAIVKVEFCGRVSAADVVKSAPPRLVPADA